MTHLSLFSGIGGLDLAAEWAGFETVGQCEWADFPHSILEKHWPDVPKWRDIHDLTATDFFARTGLQEVTCISGGFPCQPHSLAGKRKASSDERDLWPEMRRVISEIKPRWVVAENVAGLLSSEDGRFFRGILRDFAEMGFNVGWATYPAAAVGAIHRRERMAIVAYANCIRRNCLDKNKQEQCDKVASQMPYNPETWKGIDAKQNDLLSAGHRALYSGIGESKRNDDGLSEGMVKLKAFGNAVCPQQFYPIFKAIADYEMELIC
ncbi:MAG TPA: DNA cytosine methyltransferase [Bacillota bacterium]|nr:DNA cytosine methyltransferase [Bacillota bacterium]